MAKVVFKECDEDVYTLMHELINEYHSSLRNAEIKCLFYDKPKKHGGKIVLGDAEVVNSKFSFLTGINFIISIFEGAWAVMAEQEHKALVDHELHHCFVGEDKEGNPVYKIVPHDFEEFKEIIERYGLWQDNIVIDDSGIEEE